MLTVDVNKTKEGNFTVLLQDPSPPAGRTVNFMLITNEEGLKALKEQVGTMLQVVGATHEA